MAKRSYYKAGLTFDHIRAVSNALDRHNIPRDIKRVIFKHYKQHYRVRTFLFEGRLKRRAPAPPDRHYWWER